MNNLLVLEQKLLDNKTDLNLEFLDKLVNEFLELNFSNESTSFTSVDKLAFFIKCIEAYFNLKSFYNALRLSIIALEQYKDSPYILYYVCKIFYSQKDFKKLLMTSESFFRTLNINKFTVLDSINLDTLEEEIDKKLLGNF